MHCTAQHGVQTVQANGSTLERGMHADGVCCVPTMPLCRGVLRFAMHRYLDMDERDSAMLFDEIRMQENLYLQIRNNEHTPAIILEMSHFFPKGYASKPLPVILIRTPYDRNILRMTAERFCKYGYHVITQDTRNSPPSETLLRAKAEAMAMTGQTQQQANGAPSSSNVNGALPINTAQPEEFFPIVHESTDGIATLRWIAAQPWCDGNIGMYGPSYLAMSQYAVVDYQLPQLKCLAPIIAASHVGTHRHGHENGGGRELRCVCDGACNTHPVACYYLCAQVYPILFPFGTMNLDLTARWLYIMYNERIVGPTLDEQLAASSSSSLFSSSPSVPSIWQRLWARFVAGKKIIRQAENTFPFCDVDLIVANKRLQFFREMLRHANTPVREHTRSGP